jgi:hypothetical protein
MHSNSNNDWNYEIPNLYETDRLPAKVIKPRQHTPLADEYVKPSRKTRTKSFSHQNKENFYDKFN